MCDINCCLGKKTKDLIKKLELYQKNLNEYSLETVKMFLNDAIKNNLKIK